MIAEAPKTFRGRREQLMATEASEIRISVRQLVEFLLRAGDLDNRSGGSSEELMQLGSRMHRKLQKEAGGDYRAEVPLTLTWPLGELSVRLEGRADGIYTAKNAARDLKTSENAEVTENLKASADAGESGTEVWTIDEIKTTYRNLRSLRAPQPVHLAQAKCYAYMYALQEELELVQVRMTYANLLTEKLRYFYETYSADELHSWFSGLMEEYRKWAEYEYQWKKIRTKSIKDLAFPFPYREGQKDLAAGVYRTIVHGRKLFLEAPTGTGKTITTLYPAVKSMGEGKTEKIFYLTAKTITRTAAQETTGLMREKGLCLKSVTLTAKDKICVIGEPDCNPDACPRAKGHYDRINEALYALLTGHDRFGREDIEACAEAYQVCPFELGLDISLFCDLIIGDYNYLFDPHASLKRFFAEGTSKDNYVFLIDEAHNLIERGREMYSAQIRRSDVRRMQTKVKEPYPDLEKKLRACARQLRVIDKSAAADFSVLQEIDPLADSVRAVEAQIAAILQENMQKEMSGKMKKDPLASSKRAVQKELLSFYFEIRHFTDILERLDDHYRIYAKRCGREDILVRLYCVDPSTNVAKCMNRGRASILFSATFLPIQYYKSLLGGTQEDYEIYATSVFDSRKRGLYIINDVTSRYTRRSEEEFCRIAACISAAAGQRHGNYLAFFPSYAFLEEVSSRMPEQEDTEYLVQQPNMTEEQRERFLQRFSLVSDEKSLIGMCVLGGIFGEGIDLQGDALIGVMIVGTGIPQICDERELLKQYFDDNGKSGYDYAYRYPGMNKVLQAAGRVIRTQEDVGIVALLDDRFLLTSSQRLFPREWMGYCTSSSAEIGRHVERFWDEWL